MRRAVSLFVVMVAVTVVVSLPALSQVEDPWAVPEGSQEAAQYEQGVDEAQYDQEAGCGYWHWGYQFRRAGAWENWCWDPQWGWWYAESEDGKSRFIRLT